MHIFYDENIPYAAQFFAEFGQLHAFSGRDVNADALKRADVLLVRSITQVNQQLLADNKQIQFVGTATIGFDHVDRDYLSSQNIAFTNAPGCNAVSVAEYVLSSIMVLSQRLGFQLADKCVGIVGAGNTGSALAKKLAALGVQYKLCDPLLAKTDDARDFVSLEQICECDVISLHVPKTLTGEFATYHMFDQQRLEQLCPQQILINACRGEVIDNHALLRLKQQGGGPHLVLDVWENEPNILTELIDHCQIATAHIAGYSLEGKARGTEMLYQALCKHLGRKGNKQLPDFLPKQQFADDKHGIDDTLEHIRDTVFRVYDVRRDDTIFRQQLSQASFDGLRKNYPVRREFSALHLPDEIHRRSPMYRLLGFQ
ncbi:4-phosphoerythronate dehydrogenase [Thalassotalea ponticola]|uniref:4-phosphoerythronate dehydrogenase n=1 Tax=Thalassotalea ponticola TaxID=1523392 RepID=UPI0025B56559|nr:4-phosphoerythronate dehydrogenase [Thalassotalea ponticola]MDN3653156.1 4-phosphoerythronate dehydrogenase [Thalassotalea ponticola]